MCFSREAPLLANCGKLGVCAGRAGACTLIRMEHLPVSNLSSQVDGRVRVEPGAALPIIHQSAITERPEPRPSRTPPDIVWDDETRAGFAEFVAVLRYAYECLRTEGYELVDGILRPPRSDL